MKDQNQYDSTKDTLEHISRVREYLIDAAAELMFRAKEHDKSKLGEVEKPIFDRMTPKLAKLTYGSEEYKEALKELGVALGHHYKNNSHHPEHYEDGINGMNLFDIIEMFFDWKAASERHDNGDIYKSFEINKERFGMSSQLLGIFINTANLLEWKS